MSQRTLILLTVVTIIAAAEGRAVAQAPPPRTEPEAVGRFQLVRGSADRIYLVDTATGQCWSRTADSDWRDEGKPARARVGPPARRASDPAPVLDLPLRFAEMVVVQREEKAIPGSGGAVRVRLGDITGGQVLLTVVTAEGKHLLETTSVSQGDVVEFWVQNQRYTIHVRELRNFLVGDDFAKLTVAEAPPKHPTEKLRSPEREK